ncbi:MAG: hypothetical protein NXY57DRAFT_1043576 [Lentinula lateritia]|nr:MAG: hypothetical protein NXY57DRAFT_1043576 [Lentinula lateritia]
MKFTVQPTAIWALLFTLSCTHIGKVAPVALPREFSIQGNVTTLATRGTQTYYRAIRLDDNTTNKVGTHPTRPELKAGDFSNQWGYYMFPDKEDAMFWGNQHKTDDSHQFGVVELDFSLPTGVTSYSFPSANPEWTTFISANYNPSLSTSTDRPLLQGKHYSVIKGPMSYTDGSGSYAQETSRVTDKPLSQLAIVADDGLKGVTVKKLFVYQADSNWQGGPPYKTVKLVSES